jgi:hypothetical protein
LGEGDSVDFCEDCKKVLPTIIHTERGRGKDASVREK